MTIVPEFSTKVFTTELATALGLDDAIVLEQLHFWSQKPNVGIVQDNQKFIWNSISSWHKQLPFLSPWKIRKAFERLRDKGIVIVKRLFASKWNQVNCFSIRYDTLYQILGIEKELPPKEEQKIQTKSKKNSHKKVKVKNEQWEDCLDEIGKAGININQSIKYLVQKYTHEEVKAALALYVVRRNEGGITNPNGYFSQALREGWKINNREQSDDDGEVKEFRIWYSLAREIGCVDKWESRDNKIWVQMSGEWQIWQEAVERGWSLEYLRKRARN